jgi:hypothetical protein
LAEFVVAVRARLCVELDEFFYGEVEVSAAAIGSLSEALEAHANFTTDFWWSEA